MNAFLADDSPDAFGRVVDRLLASPHYGERWGRHWLDVVRYADTAGETADFPVPDAWRYRNYVIDCLQWRQAVRRVSPRANRRRHSCRAAPRWRRADAAPN